MKVHIYDCNLVFDKIYFIITLIRTNEDVSVAAY